MAFTVSSAPDFVISACHHAGMTALGNIDHWALPPGEFCTDRHSGHVFTTTSGATLTVIWVLLALATITWIAAQLRLRRLAKRKPSGERVTEKENVA